MANEYIFKSLKVIDHQGLNQNCLDGIGVVESRVEGIKFR